MNRHSLPRWLLVVLWCAFIIYLAAAPSSTADHTEEAIRQVSDLAPGLASGSALEKANYWLRRSAHAFLYGALGFLSLHALAVTPGARWPAFLAILLSVGVAGLDDGMQGFAPGRTAKLADVGLDGAWAASITLLTAWLAGRRRPPAGIIQAVTLAEVGGAQKVVLSLLQATAGRYPTMLVCGAGGDLWRWAGNLAGVRVQVLDAMRREPSPYWDLRTFGALVRLLVRERPLILHLHSSKVGVLGRLAAWAAGVPCVLYTAHGWPIRDDHSAMARRLYAWLERGASLLTDQVVCVSESERQLALAQRLAPAHKLRVIRNGVAPPPAAAGRLFDLLGTAPSTPVVVAVGRLRAPKDPLGFIALAAATRTAHPDARFVWIGDGPLRPACAAAMAAGGLGGRVVLLGTRDDARELINDAAVCVLLSRAEGLPLAVLEAMWAGKPVVASDVGGVPELVHQGINGLLCPPGDQATAAAHLGQLLADAALGRRMGAAGRRIAAEHFGEARMVRQYLDLYEAVFQAQR